MRRTDLARAAALLEGGGYAPTSDRARDDHHHSYERAGVAFELHWRLPVVSESDEERLAMFEDGIDRREWREVEGYRFPALPAPLNGLVLVYHIDHHLRSGLGLRQIVDWMMYVNGLAESDREELRPLLEESGVCRLAKTITVLCQRHLGLPAVVEDDDPTFPADRLLAYVLEQGNFGRKLPTVDRSIISCYSNSGPLGFLSRLQAGGLSRWEAAREHRALRPLAWAYQGIRIIGVLARSGKDLGDVLGQVRHGDEHRRLIEALGLRADRTIPPMEGARQSSGMR